MRRIVGISIFVCLLGLVTAVSVRAGTLDDIKARGMLVAGVKDSQPPFGFIDPKTGQAIGYEIDLMRALAKRLGVPLVTKPVSAPIRIPLLVQGAVDIVAATMTHTRKREALIDFSITYFLTGQKLLVKAGSGIGSAADLAGKKVAVVAGSTSGGNLKKMQPDCILVPFDSPAAAFSALRQGTVAAMTSDEVLLAGLRNAATDPGAWAIVGETIAPEPYALGLPQNDSAFRDAVNLALMDMWEKGDYQKIYEKWFGKGTREYLPLTWKMELWP